MKKDRIVLIILGFGILCIAYYCLFPKYYFTTVAQGMGIYRCNRITGKVQLSAGRSEWFSIPKNDE